jgi:hypothetical protein
MKRLLVILAVGFVLVMSQGLRKVAAGDDEGRSHQGFAGKFSDTAQGTFALCLDPTNNFAQISCADTKAKAFPLTTVQVGNETDDAKGNSCETYSETDSDLPPDPTPPFVATFHSVATVKSFDPETGAGDGSFTSYSGGKCEGASFDSSGATVSATGTYHFVVGDHGKRVDFLLTSLTNPAGAIGDFSFSGTTLRQ